MALAIITAEKRYEWHLGENWRAIAEEIRTKNYQIQIVYADGDELDLIARRLQNIPYSYQITEWRAPFAQFIVENLKP